MKTGKKLVYTAIFGGRDKLYDPQYVDENCDYVCFTDNSTFTSNIWNICHMSPIFNDPVMSAKLYKILPQNFFSNYEQSAWIDGNMMIKSSLIDIFKFIDNAPLACFDHNESTLDSVNCIYDEAERLLLKIKHGKHPTLDPDLILRQISLLEREHYPKQNGLISGNLLLRNHMNMDCINMMQMWWSAILNGSRRDELSFNYLAWKTGFSFNFVPGDFKNNEWFIFNKHIR